MGRGLDQAVAKLRVVALLAATFVLQFTTPVGAMLTGNPAVDLGWAANGNSLNNGAYVAGIANFGYSIYSTSFLADSSLASSIGAGWNAGDSVLGIGGKMQSTNGVAAGWGGSFTGAAVNSNLTSSARVIAKFGSLVANNVTASTVRPDGGNGVGSFGNGNTGDGAILLASQNGGTFFTTASQSTFLPLSFNQRYDATTHAVTNVSNSFGRVIYKTGATDVVDSWEVLLNTTLLSHTFSLLPTTGARSVLSMQRGTGATTDAMLSVTAVPEAGSIALGCLTTSAIAIVVFIRRVCRKRED